MRRILNTVASQIEIFLVNFNADESPAEFQSRNSGRPASHEGVKDRLASFRRPLNEPFRDRRLLRRGVVNVLLNADGASEQVLAPKRRVTLVGNDDGHPLRRKSPLEAH